MRSALLILPFYLIALDAAAQDRLQSPAEFLGYELGKAFTPYDRIVDYVDHVADHSAGVSVQQYGTTYEGRPLVVAYVSTPENLKHLDEIRQNNLRLAGLEEGEPAVRHAVVVWLSYNVHGNEAVNSEAAMATLFDLADAADSETQALLENTVVIIDPCLNPDGRERYVNWYRSIVGDHADPDLHAREHEEPWPSGRTNHYYFDLNRDWAWGTQQETRARLALYNRWMPQVHVDFHEQEIDAPYYFAPAAEPVHTGITPAQRQIESMIGRSNAQVFDRHGWLYFRKEVYDLLYPGYGDTWPLFNGSVGMTYEQAGSAEAGLAVVTAAGDTLTLRKRIAHHHASGMATVRAASEHAPEILGDFADYFSQPARGRYDTFVVKAAGKRTDALADLLDLEGVHYTRAGARAKLRGLSFASRDVHAFDLEPGDVIISTDQPKSVLTDVLLEPEADLSDSLTYDVSAWSLPYAFDLDAYALKEPIHVTMGAPPVTSPSNAANAAADHSYAYLLPWASPEDARQLAALLKRGIKARFAERPFRVDGADYGRGAVIFTRIDNRNLADQFDAMLDSTDAVPIGSGAMEAGPDLGSDYVHYLDAPRVAVLASDSLDAEAVGEVWHYFDKVLDYPASLVQPRLLDKSGLDRFDVLVLPDGSYDRVLSTGRFRRLRAWIEDGGRVIALDGALNGFAGKDGFHLKAKPDSVKAEEPTSYAERERFDVRDQVPGAIFRVRLDPTHPLAFGYDDTYYTLRRSADVYDVLSEGWNVGIVEEGRPMSGFAGFKAQERIAHSLAAGVDDIGRGNVVYFVDDPIFRGYWYGGRLLFANAVFFVGQ